MFDKMTSREVIQSVWNESKPLESTDEVNVHEQCSASVEGILRDSMNKRSLDNVTVVMVAFNNYQNKLVQKKTGHDSLETTEHALLPYQSQQPLSEIKSNG